MLNHFAGYFPKNLFAEAEVEEEVEVVDEEEEAELL